MSKTEVGDEDSFGNYGCDQCEKVFGNENFLDLYTAIEENFLVIFKCDICKMTADSGTRLNSHMKAKHIKFYGIIAR